MKEYIIENGNFYHVAPSGAFSPLSLGKFIQENFAKELDNAIKADYNKVAKLGDDLTFDVIELLGLDKRNKDMLYFVCSIVFYEIELGKNK